MTYISIGSPRTPIQVEDADPTSSARRGGVNRMIGLDDSDRPYDAVNLGSSFTPTALVGRLAAGGLPRRGGGNVRRAAPPGPADRVGATYRPSTPYPRNFPAVNLSDPLQDTAQVIKDAVGTAVVPMDHGSPTDLGALRSRVTVVTISEFGRRVQQNGNQGLDHGRGNTMLLLGGGVSGGRWPGLSSASPFPGPLDGQRLPRVQRRSARADASSRMTSGGWCPNGTSSP